MGQYYRPVVLKKNYKTANNPVEASLSPYDYGNGAKLMEHSYVANSYVRSVEFMLANQYKGRRFAWVGDYASDVNLIKTTKHPDGIDLYNAANNWMDENPNKYRSLRSTIPVMCAEYEDFDPYLHIPYYKYLVNYTKKEYCTIPKYNPANDEYVVNPLPLLTADGNGQGGGDYYVEDARVGSWAYDSIGITNDSNEIKGFKRISGKFKRE